MGKNTAWGNKAYTETQSNGGSKDEAKHAAKIASDNYHKQLLKCQLKHSKHFEEDKFNFHSSINGYGINWHISEDL